MIYGYARVSAKTQLKGNSLEEQRIELERDGCEVIIEEQFTGKTTLRPKFEELVKNQLLSAWLHWPDTVRSSCQTSS